MWGRTVLGLEGLDSLVCRAADSGAGSGAPASGGGSPDGGGGASSPIPAPSGGSSGASASESGSEFEDVSGQGTVEEGAEFAFPDHFDESQDSGVGEAQPAKPAVAPEKSSPQQPTQQTTPATQAQTTPQTPPQAVPPQSDATKPQTPAASAATPDGQQQPTEAAKQTYSQMIEAGREKLEAELSATRFKLSDADVNALETGDFTAVSRLMSKTFVEGLRSMAEMIEQTVPNLVLQAVRVHGAQKQSDDAFYGQFSQLRGHEEQVHSLAQTLRKMNPDMPRDQFIPLLGRTAMSMLGIEVVTAPQKPPANPATRRPATPHSPVVTTVPSALAAGRPVDPNSWEAQDQLFDLDV